MSEIIEIKSIYEKGPDVFSSLTGAQLESRQRPEEGLFIAESPNVIISALDAGYEPVSLLMERKRIAGLPDVITSRCENAPIYTGEPEVLESLTGFRLTRGILCAFRRRSEPSAGEVIRGKRRIAVLWDVVDPTNVGSIFRSAAGLGAEAVLISPRCCSPLHRRALRVSMGTVFKVPWAVLPSEEAACAMGFLKREGFFTAAFALKADAVPVDTRELKAREKLAVVLGTEGDGLPDEVITACDAAVYIPMRGGVDSLNVGAAAAVGFWELFGK